MNQNEVYMKRLFVLISILLSQSAAADTTCYTCAPPPPKPKVIYKTIEKQAPCCDKDKGRTDANASAASEASTGSQTATTGNQSVIVNIPKQFPTRIIIRERYRTKIKHEKEIVEVFKPNRLQLLLGLSKTKMEVETDPCGCVLSAKRVYEPDVGLQYLRDFGSFTGSIAGTVNKNVYLGLGFNW
jgi:hypothetical protein